MADAVRAYRINDYSRVGDLLVDTYRHGPSFTNWLQPRWEYMHHHPLIDGIDLGLIGIVEHDRVIQGVIHPEAHMHELYLQRRSGDDTVVDRLLEHAVTKIDPALPHEQDTLGLYLSQKDHAVHEAAIAYGFERSSSGTEPQASFDLGEPIVVPQLPDGFSLASLDDELDLTLINRVLWRGFNHRGPPPEDEIPGRARMKSAPNFRSALTMVAKSPSGDYAAYCGMWFVRENRVAYVEPVATDPDYRRMGLGSAVVLESLRRVRAMGAEIAWVGSDQPFYTAIGFDVTFQFDLWTRRLTG